MLLILQLLLFVELQQQQIVFVKFQSVFCHHIFVHFLQYTDVAGLSRHIVTHFSSGTNVLSRKITCRSIDHRIGKIVVTTCISGDPVLFYNKRWLVCDIICQNPLRACDRRLRFSNFGSIPYSAGTRSHC